MLDRTDASRDDGRLPICHYCDYQMPAAGRLSRMQFSGIRYGGLGTQRLEAEVKARFPGYRSLRMDTDTMQKPGSHEALAAFRAGDVRILLGTQMIAKGLDFPNVTLVGVINADTALHLPDFRAAERTFQLVTQVAGRTGRGDAAAACWCRRSAPSTRRSGRRAARLCEFALGELPTGSASCYPPFSFDDPADSARTGRSRGRSLRPAIGPATARRGRAAQVSVARVWGSPPRRRWPSCGPNIAFNCRRRPPDGAALHPQAVSEATANLKPGDDIQWIADVDPIDML